MFFFFTSKLRRYLTERLKEKYDKLIKEISRKVLMDN